MNIDMPADFGVFFSAQLYEKTCSKIAQSKPVPAVPTAERWGLELSSLVPQQGVLGDLLTSAFQDGEMGWSTGTPAGPKKKGLVPCRCHIIFQYICNDKNHNHNNNDNDNNNKYTFNYIYIYIYHHIPINATLCTTLHAIFYTPKTWGCLPIVKHCIVKSRWMSFPD